MQLLAIILPHYTSKFQLTYTTLVMAVAKGKFQVDIDTSHSCPTQLKAGTSASEKDGKRSFRYILQVWWNQLYVFVKIARDTLLLLLQYVFLQRWTGRKKCMWNAELLL